MNKIKFNLELSSAANELLDNLQTITGKSKAEILRMGIAYVKYAEDLKDQSGSFAIVKGWGGRDLEESEIEQYLEKSISIAIEGIKQ